MKDLKRITTILVVGLALLFQLMNPTLAHADDSTPQPSDTPVQTSTSEPTEAATRHDLSATPAPADASLNMPAQTATGSDSDIVSTQSQTADPADITPADSVTPTVDVNSVKTITPIPPADSTETAKEPTKPAGSTSERVETTTLQRTSHVETPTVSDALQRLPAHTNVIVLDQSGEALPLASQATANIIAQADPLWCPAGVVPGGAGCTASYSTIADLLINAAAYINSQSVNGTIWITSGNVGDASSIVIDGSSYTNWANYALTLQGGWSGITGDMSIGANSVFSVPITIANWNNTVGIANITTNTINVNNPNGIVILADVRTNNANINNAKGRIDIYNSIGNLNITNADINNNGLYSAGINIHTLIGDLTVSNSAFHGNGYDGIWMDTINNVTINNSAFYQNANNGMGVYNANSVTINNSTFSGNDGNGMAVSGAGNITISNGTFNDNLFHGIYITNATGEINLANITSTANPGTYGDGAYLDNTAGTGSITLTGTNDFSNHNPGNSGMYILSNGDVSLDGITSNNNGRGVNISQAGNVTITNGSFNGNVCDCEGSGAYVISFSGDVAIGHSVFTGNTLYINNPGNVTVDSVSIDHASGFGLGVETGGNVTINKSSIANTAANYSNPVFPWGDGADIFTNGGNVAVIGSQFSGNSFDGMFVVNAGNITVDRSAFNWNQIGGLDAANPNMIAVSESEFTANGPYYDLFASCPSNFLSLIFDDSGNFSRPAHVNIQVDNNCSFSNYLNTVSNSDPQTGRQRGAKKLTENSGHNIIPSESHVELFLCWDPNQKSHRVNLPNGDKVEIICPVGGKASISRLDNTTLPGELPAGYTFASAFQVEISQLVVRGGQEQRSPIDVIAQGGYIKASFVAPSEQTGGAYSILYWDNGTWIPLKDFMLDQNGLSHTFSLHSDQPNDPKKIIKGVEFLDTADPPRVEVSVNFPGIFVLAQH